MSALDTAVLVILGSMLSRAVNGSAGFFASFVAALALVVAHEVLAALGFRFPKVSAFISGRPRVLVRDGAPDRGALRHSHITDTDLEGHLRLGGNIASPSEVREARLERSGAISVLKRSSDPKKEVR